MIVTFTRSFEKSLEDSLDENRVKDCLEKLLLALQQNINPHGLGLKKLRDSTWEIRVTLKTRVLFSLFPGEIRFLLVGSHDQISRTLKA